MKTIMALLCSMGMLMIPVSSFAAEHNTDPACVKCCKGKKDVKKCDACCKDKGKECLKDCCKK